MRSIHRGVELDGCLLLWVMAVRMEKSEQNPNRVGEVNLTDANLEMI